MTGSVDDGAPAIGDDRPGEAAVHLQRAAIEFIAAARALLDVAEEAVREPAGLINVVGETIGALLGAVGSVDARSTAADSPAGPHGSQENGAPRPSGARSPSSRAGVEHIRIT